MRTTPYLALLLLLPGYASADAISGGCTTASSVPAANTLSPAPLASGLVPAYADLGATGAVLAHAYDPSQSIDQVLLRLRLAGCGNIANAIRAIKSDQVAPRLQREFFEKAQHPLETKQ